MNPSQPGSFIMGAVFASWGSEVGSGVYAQWPLGDKALHIRRLVLPGLGSRHPRSLGIGLWCHFVPRACFPQYSGSHYTSSSWLDC